MQSIVWSVDMEKRQLHLREVDKDGSNKRNMDCSLQNVLAFSDVRSGKAKNSDHEKGTGLTSLSSFVNRCCGKGLHMSWVCSRYLFRGIGVEEKLHSV